LVATFERQRAAFSRLASTACKHDADRRERNDTAANPFTALQPNEVNCHEYNGEPMRQYRVPA
jgi:hypothetical protein